ncbi:MAG: DUF1294 domain-containing protein [Ruminococcus sp.]|nr:DUF1294 domain-containing protein [Ruminococcus sp.]MCM1381034.1 DUF1294 domain-containing protein [Muribaculaceae bacterium]MCM1479208.1 DUF1294 domain-containing protein [Muribaculaceae bacterium]
MKYFLIYLAIISLIAAVMTVSDKSRAKRHKRRIPEKTLFGTAFLGGSAAMFLTMLAVRHKTKHKRFMIGLPLIMTVQAAAIAFLQFLHL